jgi:ferredoxin
MRRINNKLAPEVYISRVIDNVDGIINLPKLKTHGLTTYTGCVKNLYGTVPGLRKAEYHKAIPPGAADFGAFIGEIYLLSKHKIRLNIMDGVWGMEGNGPSAGDVRIMNLIAASRDANALDMALVKMLGMNPLRIGTIKYISNLKGETRSTERIELRGEPPASFNLAKFKVPSTWFYNYVPRWLIRFLGSFIWLKPQIINELCTNCMMCVNSCPVKAITKESPNDKPRVNAKECISCLCCHELCLSQAIELKKSPLAKLVIRG